MLGGTAEARDLASELAKADIPFISSLAGRVSNPRLPVGETRVGGFGGLDGLITFIRETQVTHVIDATHPFAQVMSEHAAQASSDTGIPLIRLERPSWVERTDARNWNWESDLTQVRRKADELGARPFITSGRQTLHAFRSWNERTVLVRVVEPLDEPPPSWTVVLDRGPYTMADELVLLQAHAIDVLITKDSGGSSTSAKLDAAAALGVPVVVLSRPPAAATATVIATVEACLTSLREMRDGN